MEYRDEKATRLQTIFMFEEIEINSAVKKVKINSSVSTHTDAIIVQKNEFYYRVVDGE